MEERIKIIKIDCKTDILANFYKWIKRKLKIQINGVVIEGLVDTGTGLRIIAPES